MKSARLRSMFLLLSLAFSSSCEDDASQPAARDRAVEAVCDKFNACGEVGTSGATYASRSSCRIDQASNWEKLWPPQECDGRIDTAQLDLCISAIEAAECGESLDVLNVLLNKCPKNKICAGAARQ